MTISTKALTHQFGGDFTQKYCSICGWREDAAPKACDGGKRSTKASDRDQAIAQLREWIKPGDTVYTIIRHVTRSGGASVSAHLMEHSNIHSRTEPVDISFRIAHVLGFRMDPDHGGVKVGYMGERRDSALVHDLARVLYGSSTALRQVAL